MYDVTNCLNIMNAIDDFIMLHGYETYDLAVYISNENDKKVAYLVWRDNHYEWTCAPQTFYTDSNWKLEGVSPIHKSNPDYIWEGGEKWKKREDEESL